MAKRKQKKPQPKDDKPQKVLTALLIIKAVADIVEDFLKIFDN